MDIKWIRGISDWLRRGHREDHAQRSHANSLMAAPAQVSRIPQYFTLSWADRREQLLARFSREWPGVDFTLANADYIDSLTSPTSGNVHVIFNLGADALRNFIEHNDYKNVYERPVVHGVRRQPSPKRIRVDSLVGLTTPEKVYFCALSMGGTGMRFYGEYCVVLKHKPILVLDRNSYDLDEEPIRGILSNLLPAEYPSIVRSLMSSYPSPDCADLLAIKVIDRLGHRARRYTRGAVAGALLSDEDFVEAYHYGKIDTKAVLEVRAHPEDEAIENSIDRRFRNGESVMPEELQWVAQRQQARKVMEGKPIAYRVMSDHDRGPRWK
ncbi:hypothetical protein [Paraburkholderia sp. J11-2]|uniref:hypothetical protein n=1 Tax=Paraburkholderia sp. J11-2 TaxID=2805431 RepID=UPI002AB659D8|nr:hypothetical protein [Paraburkholderia sp. J11-2]